jgi:hypothetical protein
VRTSPDGARRDEGRDATVVVWNATVARIPASALVPDSARDTTDGEDCAASSVGEENSRP